jgi:hypothetical protein
MRAPTPFLPLSVAHLPRRPKEHAARKCLIPASRVLGKSWPLNSYNAEPLPGGSLHHDPAFQAINHPCSQRFEACHLSRNVVGFDIDVNTTLMLNALDLDDRLVGRRYQHAVIAASPRMIGIHFAAQCIGPESSRLINIRYAAINQKSAKTRVVHGSLFGFQGER